VPVKLGLVVGKFAPPHRGHDLLLSTALEYCEEIVVLVYANPDFPQMPSSVRADWLRQSYPQARVWVPENPPPDSLDDFTHRQFVLEWLEQNLFKPEVVFTSEHYGPGFAAHLGIKHVNVDLERLRFPVSGTQVRAQLEVLRPLCQPTALPEGRWVWPGSEDLPLLGDLKERVLRWLEPIHRVVFLGAESTGKSTLSRRMALEYGSLAVAEYGREVWEGKNGLLEPDDYTRIARGHLALEDAALRELNAARDPNAQKDSSSATQYLFCDTNALTTLHFAYYYGRTAPLELHALAQRVQDRYHHVFVCNDDLPFEQDGTRDSELTRSRTQGLILYDLERRGVAYTVVSGSLEARVAQVGRVLEGMAQSNKGRVC